MLNPAPVAAKPAGPANRQQAAELKKAPITRVTPTRKPVEIAQPMKSPPASPAPAPSAKLPKELPHTASDYPLIALLGLLSLAAGVGLRFAARAPLRRA